MPQGKQAKILTPKQETAVLTHLQTMRTADPATIISNQRYRSSFYTKPAGASTGVPLSFLPLADLLVSIETVAMTRG